MTLKFDKETGYLVGGVLVLLIVGTITGQVLRLTATGEGSKKTIRNLNDRMKAWWMMVAIFGLAMLSGGIGSVVLFGLTSFLALREFITLTPTSGATIELCFGFSSLLLRFSTTWSPSTGTAFFRYSSLFTLFCSSHCGAQFRAIVSTS